MNKLLIDDYPIQVLPKLAKEIGLNEAIFIQQLHYWLNGKSAKYRDGHKWVYNTYSDWQKQFPFWSTSTIRRTISSCVKQKIILKGNYNKAGFDNTPWYSVDYEEMERLNRRCVQNEQTDCSEWTDATAQNEQTNTIDYPETTSETTKDSIPFSEIIDYLNQKTGKKFKNVEGNKKFIRARWNEGAVLEDFIKVINTKLSHADDPKHFFDKEYLRPSTLFGNKFDIYLNETPVTEKPVLNREEESYAGIDF